MNMEQSATRHTVTKFKNLTLALKELEPFIKHARHLQVGDPFESFGGLRSRELLGNWLLCVVSNFNCGEEDRLTFTSDPTNGDGIIVDLVTGKTWRMEHVFEPGPHPGAPQGRGEALEKLILEKVAHKQKRGPDYGAGKTLLVLSNEIGQWFPDKVAALLPAPMHFEAIWVTGLQEVTGGEYAYCVTRLDLSRGNVPVWRVRIKPNFREWIVEPVQ
jgi:hypothetical protein